MAKRHVLGDLLLRDAPLHLEAPVLHAADVAVDDAGVVLLADVLVALRVAERSRRPSLNECASCRDVPTHAGASLSNVHAARRDVVRQIPVTSFLVKSEK